jgi:hypothetical protein
MLLSFEPVSLGAKVIDSGVHSGQQEIGRGRGYAGPLKLKDLLPLPLHLDAHALNFSSDIVDCRRFPTP